GCSGPSVFTKIQHCIQILKRNPFFKQMNRFSCKGNLPGIQEGITDSINPETLDTGAVRPRPWYEVQVYIPITEPPTSGTMKVGNWADEFDFRMSEPPLVDLWK
ncbi:histidine--tRNA ligase, partial [Striga asiatica]